MEDCKALNNVAVLPTVRASVVPATVPRKTIAEAAREYIERSRQKSHKTFIGYRTAVNLFVQSCKKTYFDEIRRDDMLDYLSILRKCVSPKTGRRFGESTVFNYFLKTMVFLNDRGIAKYVAKEDWVQKKDWPVNVDKRNKNKKYATYLEEEIAAMLQVANGTQEALIRFLLGTGFRIGETAVNSRKRVLCLFRCVLVVEWERVNCHDSAPKVPRAARCGRFKFVAEGETVPDWQCRQGDDASFARRIGQTERVTNRVP